jgi:hypothetical protein
VLGYSKFAIRCTEKDLLDFVYERIMQHLSEQFIIRRDHLLSVLTITVADNPPLKKPIKEQTKPIRQ